MSFPSRREGDWGKGVDIYAVRKTAPLLISALLLLCFSCAAPAGPRQQRIVFEPSPRHAKNVLDLHIEQIDLDGYTMQGALSAIENAVYSSTEFRFSFGVRTSRKVSEQGDQQLNIEKLLRSPSVRLHLAKTTLCAVVNDLCAQSGWSYAWFGDGLGFIDDRSYFGDKPFDCHNDRGGFFKPQRRAKP